MGIQISLNRVAKLMRQAGIRGKMARKYRPQTTQSDPTHAVQQVGSHRMGRMHHSDRSSQYTSNDSTTLAWWRKGNCLDNSPMKSFWATLKRECADYMFPNHAHARSEIFSSIMGFYNRTRQHSALGYETPISLAA